MQEVCPLYVGRLLVTIEARSSCLWCNEEYKLYSISYKEKSPVLIHSFNTVQVQDLPIFIFNYVSLKNNFISDDRNFLSYVHSLM